MYFYFYLFSSSRCGKCFVFFFKNSRITSNILAFISRILESERFYFELHPKRSETWPFSRAQWAASRMTAAGWHFKFNLNAVLCSTTDAIFPPVMVPSRDAPVLSPLLSPFSPIVVSHNARPILLPCSSTFSPPTPSRISLPSPSLCLLYEQGGVDIHDSVT